MVLLMLAVFARKARRGNTVGGHLAADKGCPRAALSTLVFSSFVVLPPLRVGTSDRRSSVANVGGTFTLSVGTAFGCK